MAENRAPVGVCPNCRTRIRRADVLIEYRTATGNGVFAECPSCRDVIHPADVSRE